MANDRRRTPRLPGDVPPRLPFEDEANASERRDEAARRFATDPRRNAVLEASAGTGKTTVLVNRYLNLLQAGVDPRNILAITFTRKAATEMRQRIVRELRTRAALSAADAARWHDVRDRLGDIAISTIDAFCLSLLREFPLEAGLDPGFDVADETMTSRIRDDALDRALSVCRRVAVRDDSVALLIASLGENRLRRGLERLLDRRLAARAILRRFAAGAPPGVADACRAAANRLAAVIADLFESADQFRADGPQQQAAFDLVVSDLEYLVSFAQPAAEAIDGGARFRAAADGVRSYFLTRSGEPRKRVAARFARADFPSSRAYDRHSRAVAAAAPQVADVLATFDAQINRILARGARRAIEIANWQYRHQLATVGVLDFSELLARTIALLGRMDEFSQSRYRLESRYHHVLVDEFQDTSRAQWRLVSLLVKSWGEGAGLAGGVLPPSIFVVGDRKQSIYGFRDADATILDRARRDIQALRPEGRVRRSISRSFRSAPALLAFANDLFASVEPGTGVGRFTFGSRDAFPLGDVPRDEPRVGVVCADSPESCARGVAAEIARLLTAGTIVRDPRAGTPRPATPGDVAVLFRSREGHQEYERALAARGIAAYVYKGLGFFDADETKDLLAIVDYLGRPDSDAAAAAFLRSRVLRISDCGLRHLAPRIASALRAEPGACPDALDDEDRRVFEQARRGVAAWLPLVDRMTPAELVDRVLDETAYSYELRGPRRAQARENVKKMRALMRRIQNRGYATMLDVARHLRTLSTGDESNAAIDAIDAVNLMTVHAAKGLEFPVVFLVNVCRGTGGGRDPIRVGRERGVASVSVGDFLSDADEQEPQRDVEETKRLLYVAVTRARDRLYFSSPLTDGRFEPRRGSLGRVLPSSFAALFSRTAGDEAQVLEWTGPSGRTHAVRLCPGEIATPALIRQQSTEAGRTGDGLDMFGQMQPGGVPRIAATASARAENNGTEDLGDRDEAAAADEVDRVLGLLVHRLFQSLGPAGRRLAADDLGARLPDMLDPEDLELATKRADVLASAMAGFEAICDDARIAALAGSGEWFHEVPFSMTTGGAVVRGVVDAVVLRPDVVTVVEIKTGRARPEHEAQLDVYRTAAASLFPERRVEAVLVYARHDS